MDTKTIVSIASGIVIWLIAKFGLSSNERLDSPLTGLDILWILIPAFIISIIWNSVQKK